MTFDFSWSLAAVALVLAQPLAAEGYETKTYGHILVSCYEAGADPDGRTACIGEMASTCMETEEGGHSTLGMTSCLSGEAQIWDRFLNEEYQATRSFAAAMDEDEREYFPEFARRVEALQVAQRAWIAFRDAECDLSYAEWGSGSMRNIAWADCNLQMTAERTIELRAMRERFE